mmetsp:Transcript_157231/g.504405  ORF Transcript_157231/g.504405 Transcript_157231/m.504405 type:complete len:344 (+) Transcript_157231:115-1146(+)
MSAPTAATSAAMDVEEQHPLVAPLSGPSQGQRFSRTFLKVAVGGCAALLATSAYLVAPGAQVQSPAVAKGPVLEWMQQLVEAHAKINARALKVTRSKAAVTNSTAAEAMMDDCRLSTDASKVCVDEAEIASGHEIDTSAVTNAEANPSAAMFGPKTSACDEDCQAIYLTMAANCPADDDRRTAGTKALQKCEDTAPAEQMCAFALVEIAQSCDLEHFAPPDVDSLCTKGCVDALAKNKDSCKDADTSMKSAVDMISSVCTGCGSVFMKMQSPDMMAACSFSEDENGMPEWKPCDDKCHDFACDLATKCGSDSGVESEGYPPQLIAGIQMLVGGDAMKACACAA